MMTRISLIYRRKLRLGSCIILMWVYMGVLPLALPPYAWGNAFSANAADAKEEAVAEPDAYREAIRSAERDLADRDTEQGNSFGGVGLSEVLGLVALVAALILALWASRWLRGGGFGPRMGREMRILDRMAIGRNSTLLLVRLRDREYLLADHSGGVTLLKEQAAGESASGSPEKKGSEE